MKNQSSLPLQRSAVSPPCTVDSLFPKPLYRKLSQHRKESIRGLDRWKYPENNTKKAYCVTDRTLSPHSFLSIGRREDKTGLTLLFQQKAIVSSYRLAQITVVAETKRQGKELSTALRKPIPLESHQKRRPLRQRSLHAFSALLRTDLGSKAGRRKTILPALNRPGTPGDLLGPW